MLLVGLLVAAVVEGIAGVTHSVRAVALGLLDVNVGTNLNFGVAKVCGSQSGDAVTLSAVVRLVLGVVVEPGALVVNVQHLQAVVHIVTAVIHSVPSVNHVPLLVAVTVLHGGGGLNGEVTIALIPGSHGVGLERLVVAIKLQLLFVRNANQGGSVLVVHGDG